MTLPISTGRKGSGYFFIFICYEGRFLNKKTVSAAGKQGEKLLMTPHHMSISIAKATKILLATRKKSDKKQVGIAS